MKLIGKCFNCDKRMFLITEDLIIELSGKFGNSFFRKKYPICRECQQKKILGERRI